MLSTASLNIIAKGVHLVAAMYTKRAAQHEMFTRTYFVDLLKLHENKISQPGSPSHDASFTRVVRNDCFRAHLIHAFALGCSSDEHPAERLAIR